MIRPCLVGYKFSITLITLLVSSDGKADDIWSGLLKPSDVEAAVRCWAFEVTVSDFAQ
jgi:hypothetical protein